MEKRIKIKIVHMGYELLIKRERGALAQKGQGNRETKFLREGSLFLGRGLAETFAKKHFPDLPYRIKGVRIDMTPVSFVAAKDRG